MKRFLVLVSLFVLSVPAFAQADLQDVVDAVDEVADLLYNLNSSIGYIADGPYRLTLEDGIDRFTSVLVDESVYWTNAVDWTSDRHRERQSGIRRDLWEWFAPYIPSADMGGLIYSPNDRWGFLWYGGEEDETTDSHLEFETLVFGQNVDASILMDERIWDEHEEEFRDYLFDNAFNPYSHLSLFKGAGFGFWTGWQAEAWRRLLALQSGSDVPAWTNNVAATNALDEAYQQAGLTNETGEAVSMSLPALVEVNTNAVAWFGDGNGPAPKLAGDLEWDLQGESNEVRIFGFDELDKSLSGTLAVDFTSAPFPFIRTCCRLLVAVSTCVCLFMILRHEVDYWTTLGGSAT